MRSIPSKYHKRTSVIAMAHWVIDESVTVEFLKESQLLS